MLQRVERLGQSSSEAGHEPDVAKKIQDFQGGAADVENHLNTAGYFKEVSRQ